MTLQLNATQKTAVLTAIQKLVKAELDGCRADADADIKALYETTGADRMKVKVGDVEVGTLTLCFAKEAYEVTDSDAFRDFMLAQGLAGERKVIRQAYMPKAIALMEEHCPEGIEKSVALSEDASKFLKRAGAAFVLEGTTEVVPGIRPKPATVTGTRMTGCKPDVVMPALQALPGGVAGVLMGGVEDE